MRRMILSTLVLIPALAHAQTNATSNAAAGLQTAGTAPVLIAASNPPAALTSTAARPAVREVIKQTSSDFTETALNDGGTLSYTLRSTPIEASAPKLIETARVELTSAELAAQPQRSSVAVSMTVDEQGVPRNLAIAQSGGSVLDRKTLAAVSQYRFRPATWNDQPVSAAVTVAVSISKQ